MTSRVTRRIPALVWLIAALHLGLMATFALLYPPYTELDEVQHVDAVVAIAYNHDWPGPGKRVESQAVILTADTNVRGANQRPYSDDPTTPRSQRRSLADLGAEKPANTDPKLLNQMVQHPPGFYALGAAFLKVIPGSNGWHYDQTVYALRLLCALLLAPVPLIAFGLVRAVRGSPGVATTAAALPLLAPQFDRVGGSVNNDSLLVLMTGLCTLLLARVVMGDARWRTSVALGVALGIALFTKGFALVLIPCVAVGYLVARRSVDRWWLKGLASLSIAFVLGGWWWLANLVRYGRIQPDGIPNIRKVILGSKAGPDVPLHVGKFVEGTYTRLSVRFWGGLGINYMPPETFPHWLTNAFCVVALVAAIAAFVRWRGPRAALAVSTLLPFLLTLAIVVVGIWGTYRYNRAFGGAQGRYLYGVMAGLSAVVALGLHGLLPRTRPLLHRLLPVGVLALGGAMQLYALRYVFRVNWQPGRGADRFDTGMRGIKAFSPFAPGVTYGIFGATAVAAVAMGLAALWSLRSAQPGFELVEEVAVRDRDVARDHVALDDLEHDHLRPLDGSDEAAGAGRGGVGVQDPGPGDEGREQLP